MKEQPILRSARLEDAPALLEIYAPYVRDTAVSFEYQVPSREEFAGRMAAILEKYPYLVAEVAGEILGYAYAAPFKGRAAYDWAVETTIYIRRDAHGRGLGRALYQALEDVLRRQHITNLNACITFPNPDSIAFHQRMGYRTVAHFTDCGFKQGQWYDMVWMEKIIADHPVPPQPVIPCPALDL